MIEKKRLLLVNSLAIFSLSACGKVLSNQVDYQEYLDSVSGSNSFMPILSSLPSYQTYEVYYFNYLGQSINLILTYTSETYETAKESIFQSYCFLSEPLTENDYYLIPETEFDYESFTIKVVDSIDFDYPEQFGMLGYSDTKHQISFLFFFDDSLNRLGEGYSMQDFLIKEFWFPNA